jgi:hypothetical protein
MGAIITGDVTLTNTKQYPFNDSETIVPLGSTLGSADYIVLTQTPDCGDAGDIIVSGRARNGFKLRYTGGAKSVRVRYVVTGGDGE